MPRETRPSLFEHVLSSRTGRRRRGGVPYSPRKGIKRVSRRLVSRRHFAPPPSPRGRNDKALSRARARARAPTSRRRRHRENDSRQITPAGCDKIRDTRIKMISRDRNSARYRLKPTHLDLDVITVASLSPPSLPASLPLSLSFATLRI